LENSYRPQLVVVNLLARSFFACTHTIRVASLITGVNGLQVNSLDTFRAAMKKVLRDQKQEYIIFQLASGEQAVIHKLVAAEQEQSNLEQNGYPESELSRLLQASAEGLSFESMYDNDCVSAD
jgi:hypothetical protein